MSTIKEETLLRTNSLYVENCPNINGWKFLNKVYNTQLDNQVEVKYNVYRTKEPYKTIWNDLCGRYENLESNCANNHKLVMYIIEQPDAESREEAAYSVNIGLMDKLQKLTALGLDRNDIIQQYNNNKLAWDSAFVVGDNDIFVTYNSVIPISYDFIAKRGDVITAKVNLKGSSVVNAGNYITSSNYGINMFSGQDKVVKVVQQSPWAQSGGISIVINSIVPIEIKVGYYVKFNSNTINFESNNIINKELTIGPSTPSYSSEFSYSTITCLDGNGVVKRKFIHLPFKDTYIVYDSINDNFYLIN